MAKILAFPKRGEKQKKTIHALDNGERLEVMMEDDRRIVAKSQRSGKWFLLRKLLGGGYRSVGDV